MRGSQRLCLHMALHRERRASGERSASRAFRASQGIGPALVHSAAASADLSDWVELPNRSLCGLWLLYTITAAVRPSVMNTHNGVNH